MNQYSMNEYGLTYGQWYAAATLYTHCHPNGNRPPYSSKRLRRAWRNGECTADWAMSFR